MNRLAIYHFNEIGCNKPVLFCMKYKITEKAMYNLICPERQNDYFSYLSVTIYMYAYELAIRHLHAFGYVNVNNTLA